MVETADEPPLLDPSRSSPAKAHASSKSVQAGIQSPAAPLSEPLGFHHADVRTGILTSDHVAFSTASKASTKSNDVVEKSSAVVPPPVPPPPENGQGKESASLGSEEEEGKLNLVKRFLNSCRNILFCSWLNVLLVFVPIAILVEAIQVDKRIVFAMNAIAIIPLAGLLSYATESVASDLGDTIGALMNMSFGNAVELIILYVNNDKRGLPTTDLLFSMYVLLTETDKREPEVALQRLQLDCVPCHLPLFLFCRFAVHFRSICLPALCCYTQHRSHQGTCLAPQGQDLVVADSNRTKSVLSKLPCWVLS